MTDVFLSSLVALHAAAAGPAQLMHDRRLKLVAAIDGFRLPTFYHWLLLPFSKRRVREALPDSSSIAAGLRVGLSRDHAWCLSFRVVAESPCALMALSAVGVALTHGHGLNGITGRTPDACKSEHLHPTQQTNSDRSVPIAPAATLSADYNPDLSSSLIFSPSPYLNLCSIP